MSIEGIMAALVLTTLVVLAVALPLLGRESEKTAEERLLEKQRERLLVYYERVLKNIHDLDEDHQLGKIAPDEYAREREDWAERGVQVLKALDTLGQGQMLRITEADDAAVDQAIDDTIEAAIRTYRTKGVPQEEAVGRTP